MDVEACADTNGGYNVGWIDSGEWLSYTVNVAVAGYYDINVRVASPNTGGSLRIQMAGQDVASLVVPNTGAWQTWTTATVPSISLNAGQQILKLAVDNGGWNVNYIDMQTATSVNTEWNTMGPIIPIDSGNTPTVATDSQGNIHVVYVKNNAVLYKKYTSSFVASPTETIMGAGASYPNMTCDSNGVPHVVFTNATADYASTCYYTNRIGGSWKAPVAVFDAGSGNSIWYPRISLWNSYAYVGFQYGYQGALIGEIVRLTNLANTPTRDRQVTTNSRSCSVVNGLGQVFAPGRIPGAMDIEQFDSFLNPVCGLQRLMYDTYAGSPQTGWADKNNIVHFVSWGRVANGSYPCNDRCGLTYNNTGRRAGGTCGTYSASVDGGPAGDATSGTDGNNPSGFWNDDVAPVITVDALNTVYVAWRAWTPAGEGRIAKVDNNGWTLTCTPSIACPGSNVCTGTQFCTAITRRRWWNCEIAPAKTSGVYVVWENADTSYIRGVGIAVDLTPPGPVSGFMATPGTDRINLSWTNPAAEDFAGTMIRYKTTGYPTNPGDGTLLVDQAGTPGSTGQVTHIGPRCGSIYYYAAFSRDWSANYSSAVPTTGKIQCGDFDLDGDVDQSDAGVLQYCLSDMPMTPACAPADLNGDGFVNGADFNLFEPCMAGANRPPGC